jgi:DNA-binding transcriptional LysR family regulator/tetratricopeptide (TPR) repeat protein
MDLEARLRAFAAVARRGNFSRAAEELAISQPAVSKHVADLEAALKTRLLIREPRGARLTDAGEFLAGYLSRAEALLAQAAAGMASMASADSGTLRVAASGTPGVYLLPKAIAAFTAARPGVDLQVVVGTSAEAMEAVRNHRAELGVVGGATGGPDLELEPLIEDEIILVGPPSLGDGEMSAREIERETWISREEGSATRQAVEAAMANLGLRPARRMTLPDWEMIKIAVATGAGVAAISRFAAERELADRRLIRVRVPGWHVVRPLSIIRSRDVPMTPLAAHLAATLRRVVTSGVGASDRARAALTYAERADGHASLGDIQTALREGVQDLVGARAEDELLLGARMNSLLAFWQVKGGDLDAAEATLTRALEVHRLPPAGRADLRSRLGWLTERRGDHATAAAILEDAIRDARLLGDGAVERRAMLDLATAYSGLGRHVEAREQLDGSMERSRAAGDGDELLRAYNNGAGIIEGQGGPELLETGQRFLLEGIEEARRLGDRHHLAWLNLNVAAGRLRLGDVREAEHRLRDALRTFEDLEETGGVGPALVLLAWTRLRLGDRDDARALETRAGLAGSGGRPWVDLDRAQLDAVLDWSDGPRDALATLRRALAATDPATAEAATACRLMLARMSFRLGDAADVPQSPNGVALEFPEAREFPRWVSALADVDPAKGAKRLTAVARAIEAVGARLDAAEAYADAALLATRARHQADARRLLRERDRLLGASGAMPLFEAT